MKVILASILYCTGMLVDASNTSLSVHSKTSEVKTPISTVITSNNTVTVAKNQTSRVTVTTDLPSSTISKSFNISFSTTTQIVNLTASSTLETTKSSESQSTTNSSTSQMPSAVTNPINPSKESQSTTNSSTSQTPSAVTNPINPSKESQSTTNSSTSQTPSAVTNPINPSKESQSTTNSSTSQTPSAVTNPINPSKESQSTTNSSTSQTPSAVTNPINPSKESQSTTNSNISQNTTAGTFKTTCETKDTASMKQGTEAYSKVSPSISSIASNSTISSRASNSTGRTQSTKNATIVTKKPTSATTEQYPSKQPNWDSVSLKIQLTLVLNATFTEELNNKLSNIYSKYVHDFQEQLKSVYQHTPDFKRIEINGFSKGSIRCNYTVLFEAQPNKTLMNETIDYINKNVTQSLRTFEIKGIGQIDYGETSKLMAEDIKAARLNINEDFCSIYGDDLCRYDHQCKIHTNQNDQPPYCVYRCNLKPLLGMCGDHGVCYVGYSGKTKCRCKDDDPLFVYHGEKCNQKEEKLMLSSTYIIAIAGGGGGALVFIILIALICICCKWSKAKKASQFYRYKDRSPRDRESVAYKDDSGMQMENNRIESVPMGGYGHENHSYMVDSAPSSDGQNMRYDKGRYYRVVKDPELGSDTMIYQPSNLNTPILRESNMSRDELPSISDPLHSHYNYIDTETVYKIRRPQLGSMDSDRHGHPRTVL